MASASALNFSLRLFAPLYNGAIVRTNLEALLGEGKSRSKMQDAGVVCGLKIKPHAWAQGSRAGFSPRRPRRPRSPAGAAPSPLSCKAAPASAAGQRPQASSRGHFLFFSPTNFAPGPFITQSWG